MTRVRFSPRASWYAPIKRSPVNSPAAPAAGCNVAAAIPVTSQRTCSVSSMSANQPCTSAAGVPGWTSANPGRPATSSQIFGLYFIVHDPSGYAPRSTANWRCESRVKCATRSRSETSASSTGSDRRCSTGRSSVMSIAGISFVLS